jgi:uncharacterized RDD family membrane protein YckC
MSEFNILTAQNVSIEFESAGVGDRIVATILDSIFMFFYMLVVYFIFFAVVLGKSGNIDNSDSSFFVIVAMLCFVPVIFYHLLSEYFFNGQSLGKRIMKIRVIKLDGTEPGIGAYLLRWLLRFVDITMFSGLVAVITVAVSEKGQRLGDMAAGTTVIRQKPFVPLELLRPVDVAADHKVSFPEVERLNDKDIHTIKLVLNRWQEADNYEVVEQAAARLKESLRITDTKGFSDVDLLKTILADYAHISHF